MTEPLLEHINHMPDIFKIMYKETRGCEFHDKYVAFLKMKESERKAAEEQLKREILKRQEEHIL